MESHPASGCGNSLRPISVAVEVSCLSSLKPSKAVRGRLPSSRSACRSLTGCPAIAQLRTISFEKLRSPIAQKAGEHFAAEGSLEPLRIDIPVGGYVPVFVQVPESGVAQESQGLPTPASLERQSALADPDRSEQGFALRSDGKRWLLRASLLTAYSAALIFLTWAAQARFRQWHRPSGPADALWSEVFSGTADTYIVPADAGFNLLEDLSRRPVPLADYIKGGYLDLPLAGVDAYSAADMRSQEFTSFVDLQIVAALAGLPEYRPQRDFPCASRGIFGSTI